MLAKIMAYFVAELPEGYGGRGRLLWRNGRVVALPRDDGKPPLVLERGRWREVKIGG